MNIKYCLLFIIFFQHIHTTDLCPLAIAGIATLPLGIGKIASGFWFLGKYCGGVPQNPHTNDGQENINNHQTPRFEKLKIWSGPCLLVFGSMFTIVAVFEILFGIGSC